MLPANPREPPGEPLGEPLGEPPGEPPEEPMGDPPGQPLGEPPEVRVIPQTALQSALHSNVRYYVIHTMYMIRSIPQLIFSQKFCEG